VKAAAPRYLTLGAGSARIRLNTATSTLKDITITGLREMKKYKESHCEPCCGTALQIITPSACENGLFQRFQTEAKLHSECRGNRRNTKNDGINRV